MASHRRRGSAGLLVTLGAAGAVAACTCPPRWPRPTPLEAEPLQTAASLDAWATEGGCVRKEEWTLDAGPTPLGLARVVGRECQRSETGDPRYLSPEVDVALALHTAGGERILTLDTEFTRPPMQSVTFEGVRLPAREGDPLEVRFRTRWGGPLRGTSSDELVLVYPDYGAARLSTAKSHHDCDGPRGAWHGTVRVNRREVTLTSDLSDGGTETTTYRVEPRPEPAAAPPHSP